MRGTVSAIYWSPATEALTVPWVVFVNRATGAERLYGRSPCEQEEKAAAHLRRGEYITCVSGSSSSCSSNEESAQHQVAQYLRILTSEQQEIIIGEAAATIDSIDFCYRAEHEHEIVGLSMHQDGCIVGVKQAILAPSRVQTSEAAAAIAELARRPPVASGQQDLAAPAQPEWRQVDPKRRQSSLEVLARSRQQKIREAFE